MIILIIYAIAFLVTSTFAAYKTGQEQAHMRALQPTQIMQVNWVNCFFQGLMWPAYWAQVYSFSRINKTFVKNPRQAHANACAFFGVKAEVPHG